MRALQSSVKTSLRIDDEGLLSLQFMMSTLRRGGENGTAAFIEFWVRTAYSPPLCACADPGPRSAFRKLTIKGERRSSPRNLAVYR